MPDAPPAILMIGGTGMVGQAVLAGAGSHRISSLGRRMPDAPVPGHPAIAAPPENWPEVIAMNRPATLVSCLGTTIRQAGSQAAFRAVDHDMVLAAARAAKEAGARHMILVSSVGASAGSSNFYLRTKGEIEAALRALDFERLDILRPGLLMGDRPGPRRFGEGLATIAAPLTDALLHGSLRRYRSIPGETVAQAIVRLIGNMAPGVHIHENDAIRALAD
ncbi:NAD-dependent dehydratase [Sphingopyxis sp.]|uniref:NAD-dependent dehydratase n=1 Tax=Sphingopyxis sp. TaxID=1908224 RepID=UPI003D105649